MGGPGGGDASIHALIVDSTSTKTEVIPKRLLKSGSDHTYSTYSMRTYRTIVDHKIAEISPDRFWRVSLERPLRAHLLDFVCASRVSLRLSQEDVVQYKQEHYGTTTIEVLQFTVSAREQTDSG